MTVTAGVTVTTPSMSGSDSYLALPALTNTHHELRLDVEFKPLAPDGILLFSGGKSGPVEDFVSLAMAGGHLEFRYELGSGKHQAAEAEETLSAKLCVLLDLSYSTGAGRRRPGGQPPMVSCCYLCLAVCDAKHVPRALSTLGSSFGMPNSHGKFPVHSSPHRSLAASPHCPIQDWPFCGAPSHWPWAVGTVHLLSASTRMAACG